MEHSWPIVADALGRIPMFFVPDGYYRARLEDRYGTPLYDEAALPALSTGEGGGGGRRAVAVQWVTGDFLWQPVRACANGWVRANGRTIGNALSGASERANADCANLFAFLWNTLRRHILPGVRRTRRQRGGRLRRQQDDRDPRHARLGAMGLDGMGNDIGAVRVVPVVYAAASIRPAPGWHQFAGDDRGANASTPRGDDVASRSRSGHGLSAADQAPSGTDHPTPATCGEGSGTRRAKRSTVDRRRQSTTGLCRRASIGGVNATVAADGGSRRRTTSPTSSSEPGM